MQMVMGYRAGLTVVLTRMTAGGILTEMVFPIPYEQQNGRTLTMPIWMATVWEIATS